MRASKRGRRSTDWGATGGVGTSVVSDSTCSRMLVGAADGLEVPMQGQLAIEVLLGRIVIVEDGIVW